MNPHQKRLLLLFGIFLTLSGTYGMLFGDTLLAGRISTLFAGIGMAISLAQFFLPLGPPRDDTAQTSGLLLPSSYLQKKQPQKVDLILPPSYYYSLQRRQKQQKVNRNRVIGNIIVVIIAAIPIAAIFILYINAINISTPIDLSNPYDASTARSIIQDYCHAMIRQNYSAAYKSSNDVAIGGESINDVNTFTQKARQADQRGYLTSCTVKSGRKYIPITSGSSSWTSTFDRYDFTVEVKRSSRSVYLTHISVSISYAPFTTDSSIDIDRL